MSHIHDKVRHIYVEEVEFLRENGEHDPARIAEQLGVKPGALARALQREGRQDLARPFDALYRRSQGPKCKACWGGNHERHRNPMRNSKECRCRTCRISTDNE